MDIRNLFYENDGGWKIQNAMPAGDGECTRDPGVGGHHEARPAGGQARSRRPGRPGISRATQERHQNHRGHRVPRLVARGRIQGYGTVDDSVRLLTQRVIVKPITAPLRLDAGVLQQPHGRRGHRVTALRSSVRG
jgi:hypothetical protein